MSDYEKYRPQLSRATWFGWATAAMGTAAFGCFLAAAILWNGQLTVVGFVVLVGVVPFGILHSFAKVAEEEENRGRR